MLVRLKSERDLTRHKTAGKNKDERMNLNPAKNRNSQQMLNQKWRGVNCSPHAANSMDMEP